MKKRLIVTSLSMMLVMVIAVSAGTYALFSDNAINTGNEFYAGTVNLVAERNYGDYIQGPMFYPDALDPDGEHPYDVGEQIPSGEALGGWAPGDKVTRTMYLKNTGTLDAKITGIKAIPRATYTQTLRNGIDTRTVNGLVSGPEFDQFIQKAHVRVFNPLTNVMVYDGLLSGLIFNDPDQFAPVINELSIQTSGTQNISFEVTLDHSADNDLQGKTFIFDFAFYGEQKRNN